MNLIIDWIAIFISIIAAGASGAALYFYRRSANAAEKANEIAEEAKTLSMSSAEESRLSNEIARQSVQVSSRSLSLAEAQWLEQNSAKMFVLEHRPIKSDSNRSNQTTAPNQLDDGLRVTIHNLGEVRAAKIEWIFVRYVDDLIIVNEESKSHHGIDPGEHIRLNYVMTTKDFLDATLFRLVLRYYDHRANVLVLDFSKPKGEPRPIALVQANLNGTPQTNQALAQLTGSLEDIARHTQTTPEGA